MKIEDIVTLMQAFSENGLTSFEYEEGEQILSFKKKKKKNVAQAPVVITQPAAPMMAPVAGQIPMAAQAPMAGQVPMAAQAPMVGQAPLAPPAAGPEGKAADAAESVDIGSDKVVVSPLVGTFYSSAAPDSDDFVKVGDTVKKGQVLGIIEAMKLMNEIESEFDGVVEAILVNNEDVVEFGQPLFRIR